MQAELTLRATRKLKGNDRQERAGKSQVGAHFFFSNAARAAGSLFAQVKRDSQCACKRKRFHKKKSTALEITIHFSQTLEWK
jgi:hypothetical protein